MKPFCVAITLLLTGCAAHGVRVTEEQAQSFVVGQSTFSDVVAALGPPTAVTTLSSGQRIARYTYVAVSPQPQNFIPVVRHLASGYDRKMNLVMFTFDARDVLVRSSSTQGESGVATGLGAIPPPQ